MRVTIKGLTDSTIAFNTLGIILRGNSAKVELYPNSVAKNIEIKTEEQMRELISLKNAKLVEVIDESEVIKAPLSTKNVVIQPIKTIQLIQPIQPKPEVKETKLTEPTVEEIEDMPSVKIEEEEEILTVSSKKKLGRPKKNTGKQSKESKAKITKIKTVKRSEKMTAPNPVEAQEEDSKVVVMTPNGPIAGNMVNSMSGEIAESEATRASIEALRQMESEEEEADTITDESLLDVNNRMGEEAVIATGEKKTAKIAMKNSILPQADSIKKRAIEFIDPDGGDDKLDESIKDIFIDNPENPEDDTDNFIEH